MRVTTLGFAAVLVACSVVSQVSAQATGTVKVEFPATPEQLTGSELVDYEAARIRYLVESARNSLLLMQKTNAALEEAIANQEKAAADTRVAAEQARLRAELLARRYPNIRLNSARVFLVSDPTRTCDATYFAQWSCHGGGPVKSGNDPIDPSICSFLVDEKVCVLPAAINQPMMFEAQYSCGTEQVRMMVPVGAQAHFTCKERGPG